ncbi:MAG: hypothetical protein AAB305_03065 [Candidatus Zixiibacteriota bacterium]
MKKIRIGIIMVFAVVGLTGIALGEQIILDPTVYSSFQGSSASPLNGFALTFDLSKIPSGYRIDLAELRVTIDSDTLLDEAVAVQVVAVSGNLPVAGELMAVEDVETIDSVRFSSFVETGADKFTEINVSELVDWWYSGKLLNKGFLIFVDGNDNKEFALDLKGTKVSAKLSVYYSK